MKKFPKGGVRKNMREFVDADYLKKLSPKEREWYDDFIRSEYGANYQAAEKIKGAKLTKDEKKRLNSINNRRRRDAHNNLDRTITASRRLEKVESSDGIPGQTSEEHEGSPSGIPDYVEQRRKV